MRPMPVEEIADRLSIADLLARYTRAIDTGHWDDLDTVFTPEAVIDYTATGGIRGDRATVKAWLAEVLASFPGRHHQLGQLTVTFDADGSGATAVAAFSDVLAPSRTTISAATSGLIKGGGWYRHRLVRTPEGWRSRELVEEQAWRTIEDGRSGRGRGAREAVAPDQT